MAKSIYDCYRINGYKTGFWVRRITWDQENTFFVKRIGQQTRGRLPQNASKSELTVWGDLYLWDMITSRNFRLEFADTFSWIYLGHEKGMERNTTGSVRNA